MNAPVTWWLITVMWSARGSGQFKGGPMGFDRPRTRTACLLPQGPFWGRCWGAGDISAKG